MGLNHCFSFCACVIVGYVCFYFLFLFFWGGICGERVVLRVFVLICSLQIDKTSSYRIDLVGRIEGRGQALVFQYRMNGGEFHTQLSMQQQTVRPVLHISGLISDGS